MTRSPLAGKTILVTRPAERSVRLVKLLDQRGARAIVAPAIALRPVRSAALSAALRDLAAGRYDWLVLTSPATIAMLADRLAGPRDVRAAVAAVGDGTAEAFRRWARRDPDLRPRTFTVAALARAFPRGEGRVLCPRADIAPDGLEEALRGEGVERRARRRVSDGLRAEAAARRDGRARRGRGGRRHVHERLDRPGIRRRPRSGPRPAEGRVHRARDRGRGEGPRAHRARRRRPAYDRWTRGCFGARLRSSPRVVRPTREGPAADAYRPEPSGPETYVIRILAATVSDRSLQVRLPR